MSAADGRTVRAQRRRADARSRLAAAVQTLVASGRAYATISVEDIAAEAGLSRSMFYSYYEDKGALVREWFETIEGRVENAAASWWRLSAQSTREDLREAVADMVATFIPYAPVMVAMHDAAASDAAVRDALDGMLARSIAGLHEHILRGQAEGWVAAEVMPAETAGWLTCLAEGGQQRIERRVEEAELERIIDASVDIIWSVLYAGAPARVGAQA